MLEKVNKGLNIFILVILAIAFIILFFSLLSGWITDFKKNKSEVLDQNQIDIYLQNIKKTEEKNDASINISENDNLEIVKDYTLFYSLQDACENFLQYVIDKKYGQTYDLATKEIKSKYSNFQYIEALKGFYDKNLAIIEEIDNPIFYINRNNLLEAYKISESNYVCKVRNNAGNYFKLGIRISEKNNTYTVFYIDM